MKSLILLLILLTATASARTGNVSLDCRFQEHVLWGRIQVVKDFPDVRVRVGDFPDLRVKVVKNFPNNCGQWEMVDSHPDTRVQFVNSHEDVRIQYSDFPGLP